MESGIFLTASALASLPAEIQKMVLLAAKIPYVPIELAPQKIQIKEDPHEDLASVLAVLSLGEARTFLEGCGEKTRRVLKIILKINKTNFSFDEILQQMNTDARGLAGVWSGITKRTNTILGSGKKLIEFYQDDQGDWYGRIDKNSLIAFRRVLLMNN